MNILRRVYYPCTVKAVQPGHVEFLPGCPQADIQEESVAPASGPTNTPEPPNVHEDEYIYY